MVQEDVMRQAVKELTTPTITQTQLAKNLGISLTYFNKWVNGEISMGKKSLDVIKNYLISHS